MLTDAGSIPAASTNDLTGLDHSRPVKSLLHQAVTFGNTPHLAVSDGLQRSPKRHRYDTNWAQDVTEDIGTRECKVFRDQIFSQFESFSSTLAKEYLGLARQQDYVDANRRLSERTHQLRIRNLNLTLSDKQLQDFAREQALHCIRLQVKLELAASHKACLEHASSYDFQIPALFHTEITYCMNRLTDNEWWMRAIRKLRNRRLSEIERDIGLVSNHKSAYSSQRSVQQRRKAKAKQKEFLERSQIQNHLGQKFSLAELAEKSVSNPAVRRAELMTRISGFEKIALASGHECYFQTITTPSRMHRCLSKKGRKNPKFDGTTPREAQQYLQMIWARIRAALARNDIKPYGFRVAEPHHDGTPHWHFMLFVSREKSAQLNKIMRMYALNEDGNERGAKKHRFTSKRIDMEKGSAAGYIAKYISKRIDGAHLKEDLLGNPAQKAAEQIEAWSRDHGIRQFQQIGGASVTVWRELRRLKEPLPTDQTEEARLAADTGDWAAYTYAMGGVECPPEKRPIIPLYEHLKAVDTETGELIIFSRNKYDEKKAPQIRGLQIEGKPTITRKFAWSPDRTLIPIDLLKPGLSWTRVNNCTEAPKACVH